MTDAADTRPPSEWRPLVALADDDNDALATLAECLAVSGFRVEVAADGVALLALLKGQQLAKPEIVVTDLEMPGLSGLEVLAIVRAKGDATPFVFISGSSDPEAQTRAFALGAPAFLTKPPDVTALTARLRALSEPPPRGRKHGGEK